MAVDTLVELLADGWGAISGRHHYANDTALSPGIARIDQSPDNFTPSLFEAEPGQFRLLQPIWDLRVGREWIVASPLFPIVLSIVFYFACMLPFTVLDLFGNEWKWAQRYKIQPRRTVTWPSVRNAIVLTLWNHILYILPVSVAQCVWTPATELPALAPRLWEFSWQQYAALAVFDAEYFVWHYAHHRIRWLYRHVHSVHHHYSSPHCWVTQYLHPYELTVVGIYTTTSPWWFGAHPMTQWSFMLFSIIISVDAHIGYDLPLMPHHWAPFWGGSTKHDMHHQRPLTNFQPFFNWFDRLIGTECPGQRAAGFKPSDLIDWELSRRTAAIAAKAKATAKEAAMSGADGAAASRPVIVDDVDVSRLGNYGADEPVMEAKQF